MSEEKVDEIRKKIIKIESIGKSVRQPTNRPVPKSREYGSYQRFQSECMQKVDEAKPDSLSRVEVITGKEGIHSTERLAQCPILWGKYRNLDNPVNGLMSDLKTAQKKIKKGEEL